MWQAVAGTKVSWCNFTMLVPGVARPCGSNRGETSLVPGTTSIKHWSVIFTAGNWKPWWNWRDGSPTQVVHLLKQNCFSKSFLSKRKTITHRVQTELEPLLEQNCFTQLTVWIKYSLFSSMIIEHSSDGNYYQYGWKSTRVAEFVFSE